MQITNAKLCRLATHCRALGATAIILTFFLSGQMAQAVDGDLDPTFGTGGHPTFGAGGKVMTDFDHSTDVANAVAVQADGKLVVVGTTYINNDYTDEDFAVARYNANGTLDTTFGAGGKVRTDFPGLAAVASSVVIQPDGKIVVAGGAFPLFTFLGDFKLVRYNPDGSLDSSFGNGGIVTTSFPGQGSYAFAVALQPDGKIIAAGTDFVDFSFDDSSNTDFALERIIRMERPTRPSAATARSQPILTASMTTSFPFSCSRTASLWPLAPRKIRRISMTLPRHVI